ncbi:MAG: methylated-DNA--[protein]-cysteine S-methyltransferase [Myxococcaceae bacterium]|nr:methylated-DNA--[protein]-cysteine S-methyltransferase [Myxococcaceae bacterium]
MNTVHCWVQSPVGPLRLIAGDDGLVAVYFSEHRRARHQSEREVKRHPVLDVARRELTEYFAGTRTRFETPLAPLRTRGGTAFQHAVWNALLSIPCGETRSYSDIAWLIGRPNAVRAVGAANGLNSLSIFVPCHRVVGSDGSLTGYAGGIDGKRWLLAHELKIEAQLNGRRRQKAHAK